MWGDRTPDETWSGQEGQGRPCGDIKHGRGRSGKRASLLLVQRLGIGAQLDLELGQQAWSWDKRRRCSSQLKRAHLGVEVGPNSKAQKEANWHFWTTIPAGDATCRDGLCGEGG